ncbi:YcaO-like family protein [Sorangium sp. So ce1153]|uniref:YcaO-like family protein n=1 Tax=Sorangium sp. So ce1153 TaxID=3133333 RepID=UPI003F6052BB
MDHTRHTPKQFFAGTHRALPPEQTLARHAPHLERMGITRIANITGLDHIGIPVYTAIRPAARSISTAQGKGIDHATARASAMMEAIESWHAEWIDLPLRWDTYESLRRRAAVADMTRLPRRPGAALRLDAPQLWVSGVDLFRDAACWVPFDVVTSLYVASEQRSPYAQSSIGLASGNEPVEAVVHALCEAIERDAEALWGAAGEVRQIDLSTVREPYLREVLGALERAEVGCFAFDITSGVGVPTFTALIMDPPSEGLRVPGIHGGAGAHLDPAIALSRAITEAVQTRLTFIAGSRDDLFRAGYDEARDLAVLEATWAACRAPAGRLAWPTAPARRHETFEQDLDVLLAALRAAGITQAVAVDLSKSELGIPVVRVVVPGLEAGADVAAPGERLLRATGAA